MEVTTADDMTVLIQGCLAEMDLIEAALIQQCFLADPKSTLRNFAAQTGLSPRLASELRDRALSRLKEGLAMKRVHEIGDVI